MATADAEVLDDFLSRYVTQVDAGFGLIQGDVSGVLATLVTISIAATAILWAIDENQNVLASLVRKVLLVGFFAWLVTQWHSLSSTVIDGFVALGLKAGGGAMTASSFTTSPSQIVNEGVIVIQGLLEYVQKLAPGPLELFSHLVPVTMALIAAVGILIAFVILAVEIVVTIVEFHIVTLIAFVTIPFGVLTQTAFLSERAIGYVVSVGVKLMALAIVVSLGNTVFSTYTVSSDPSLGEDIGLVLAAVLLVMLALKIPAIAGALISGGPQLSAGSAVMGAAGVAAGVAGGALAARTVGGAIAKGWEAGGHQVQAARSAPGAVSKNGVAPGASNAAASSTTHATGSGGGASKSGDASTAPKGRPMSNPPMGANSDDQTASAGPSLADFNRAPLSSTVQTLRVAGERLRGRGPSQAGGDIAPPPPNRDTPAPANKMAHSALADLGRAAAGAALQPEQPGPGMTATPSPPDNEPEA